jgi:hypothetical protein
MRKERFITISTEGRDKGKTYCIQEMPASQAEWWAIRAFQAVTRAGIDIPENIKNSGMAGIAVMGLRAFAQLPPMDLKDLMDEMFECVTVVRDNNPNLRMRPVESDIEEVETRLFLRGEIFELHTGFSLAGGNTNSISPATQTQSTSNTQTSPGP